MSKTELTGVYQLENGKWAYRFSIMIDGKRVARRKYTDEAGNELKSKTAAAKARAEAIAKIQLEHNRTKTITRKTVEEIFEEYRENGRSGKAYNTCKKQDSLWKNHIQGNFGDRYIDDISVAEINDYLAGLYYKKGLSYRYTESFLKLFYLIFGQAYSRDYVDVDTYNKICLNKGTRIHMPKKKPEDDSTEIIAYTSEELKQLDEYFKGKSVETAYWIGRYCGLRINEVFGLKWDNIDIENGTIRVDRQMQYQNGVIRLVSVKTGNACRTVFMNDKLKQHLTEQLSLKQKYEEELAAVRKQNCRIIKDIDGEDLYATELVNCFPDGKLQTFNSFKYHVREIKAKLNIAFKFHHLRHTYGTIMADLNTPQHVLCNQMGHANIYVTQRYYIAVSKMGLDILKQNINKL